MAKLDIGKTPVTYLVAGESVLAVLRTHDVPTIAEAVSGFTAAQSALRSAVDAAVAATDKVGEVQEQLAELNADLDDAITELVRGVVADGGPVTKPLAAFDCEPPSRLRMLAVVDKATAIQQLVAAIGRSKGAGDVSRAAGEQALATVNQVASAAAALNEAQAALDQARHHRDAAAQAWLNALAVLKRAVDYAGDHDAPGLAAAVFARPAASSARSKRKRVAKQAAPPATEAAAAPPTTAAAPSAAADK